MEMLVFWFLIKMYCKAKAGTIPLIDDKVILVDSAKNKGRIVLPKGNIKKKETPEDAAIRETIEEAGLVGDLQMDDTFVHNGVKYFILKVKHMQIKYDEVKKRKRYFYTANDVKKSKNIKPGLKKMILEVMKENQ